MRKTLIVLSMLIAFSGCYRRAATVMNIEKMSVPAMPDGSPRSREYVQNAILAGCQSRGWSARVIGEDLIEAEIIIRAYRVKVHIPFSDSHYSILHESSSKELLYNERQGTIHYSYNRWISFLNKSIQKAIRTSQ